MHSFSSRERWGEKFFVWNAFIRKKSILFSFIYARSPTFLWWIDSVPGRSANSSSTAWFDPKLLPVEICFRLGSGWISERIRLANGVHILKNRYFNRLICALPKHLCELLEEAYIFLWILYLLQCTFCNIPLINRFSSCCATLEVLQTIRLPLDLIQNVF